MSEENRSHFIRHMKEDDIPQVSEIDREAFPTQWPYPVYAYKRELNNRLASYIVLIDPNAHWRNGNRRGSLLKPLARLLGQHNSSSENEKPVECIAGFAGMWRMLDEVHLTTIAVRQGLRRQGFGEQLLITVIDMAKEWQSSFVTLEVRVSNYSAQTLYRKYLFKDAGLRKGYYTEDGEDALIMTTEDIRTGSYQDWFARLKEEHTRSMGQRASQAGSTSPIK